MSRDLSLDHVESVVSWLYPLSGNPLTLVLRDGQRLSGVLEVDYDTAAVVQLALGEDEQLSIPVDSISYWGPVDPLPNVPALNAAGVVQRRLFEESVRGTLAERHATDAQLDQTVDAIMRDPHFSLLLSEVYRSGLADRRRS